MNIQELAMARVEGIAAKALVLNNLHLGMVVQWEDRFFASNVGIPSSACSRTKARVIADTKTIYPDFMKICEGFDVPARRVEHKKDLRAAMEWFLAEKGACVLEIMVPYTEHVLPMIPGGRDLQGDHLRRPQDAEGRRRIVECGTGLQPVGMFAGRSYRTTACVRVGLKTRPTFKCPGPRITRRLATSFHRSSPRYR
jgi:hypothetical protein